MARSRVKPPETRKPNKTSVQFKLQLTEEQARAKEIALDSKYTILTGRAGTAKTTLNCQIALDRVLNKYMGKILITRPTVTVKDEHNSGMGFLPGDAFDFKGGKMAPFINPILEAMIELTSKQTIEALIKGGQIEIAPIDFVRGRNFKDCVVIVDEAQNLNYGQLKALVTRLCPNTMMLFTSDLTQVDLVNPDTSAGKLFSLISKRKGVSMIELTEQWRDPLAVLLSEDIEAFEKEERDERRRLKEEPSTIRVFKEPVTTDELLEQLDDPKAPWNFRK